MLNLLRHELQSRWVAIVGWGIGLAALGSMYIAFYPQIEDQMAGLANLEIYVAMGVEMTSFAGYIASVVLQFVPLLLGIYAIITSTDTLAGEEDRGTLELIMTMPLHRWQIIMVKTVAIAIAMIAIIVIAGVGDALTLNAIKASVDIDITGQDLFNVILSSWPITMAFVMAGLFVGAYLPNRRTASVAMIAIFLVSYFGETLSGMVESLETVQQFSPFYYFDSSAAVFTEGVQTNDVLILLGVAAFFFVLTLISFQRRNVTVGAWPWQRPRITD